MKFSAKVFSSFLVLASSRRQHTTLGIRTTSMMSFSYPNARRDTTIVDDYHGVKIGDPYRWLEDPESDETKAFVDGQNMVSSPYLTSYEQRDKLKTRLTQMWDFPRYGCPYKRGPRYFYSHNTGLQNQSVVYVQDRLDGEPRVFLDPNTLSEDGTVSISSSSFTKDGSLYAVSLSTSGSDWRTVKFMDVASQEMLPDVLSKVKFSCLTWTRDNKGFFYNKFPAADDNHAGKEVDANTHQKLYYHRMGTRQSADVICAEFPDSPNWLFTVEVSDCGKYLLMDIREGCDPVNRLYYCDLKVNDISEGVKGLLPFTKVIDNFEAEYEYITNEGSVFTFKTNLNASKYKLINIDFCNPDKEQWNTLVPEHSSDVMESVVCVNQNKLIITFMHDVKNEMYMYDLITGTQKGMFPVDVGSISSVSGRKEDTEIFYFFTSFLSPGIVFRCDMTTDELKPTIFRQTNVFGFDASEFETKQVFYQSKDGERIPMFLVFKKDLIANGQSPVWMYGYGGFNISLTPYFSISRLLFISSFGGIFALPNIRGGGEYGDKWHENGMLGQKQNCFDDFQCAAEYLIKENYTTEQRIAISGGSNGGLLVAACVNQRPDLFGAAIADVGVMDLLRFHKFTIGHHWISDYGCSDKKESFDWLIKWSPLHNVREPVIGQYPPMLLCTADHDDRVVPLHSLKLIATLQHTLGKSEKQTNPLLIRLETKAGHGGGKPTTKIIEEVVDKVAFIALCLGLKMSETKIEESAV